MPQGPSAVRSADLRRRRIVVATGLGAALLLVATYTARSGFGASKAAALAVLTGLLLVSFVDRRFYWTPRLLLVGAMSYAMLVAVDAALFAIRPPVNPNLSIRHMYEADPELGYGLRPGWQGHWDDGVVRGAPYTINSRGHRDDEPRKGSGSNRVLLLGDSFTFGMLLGDDETIDRQIEAASDGRVDAYNLGIPGYGAPAVARTLERNDLPAAHAVYLFYENDLRNDGLATERNLVHQGFMMPGLDDAGRPYSEAELDARVARALATPSPLLEVLRLRHLAKAVSNLERRAQRTGFRELPAGREALDYAPENLDVVLSSTDRMRAVATQRGSRFAVLIVPSLQETVAGHYYERVERYRDALSERDIPVIEVLDALEADDYWKHDGHFSPGGARKAARAILDWVDAAGAERETAPPS
jgi:hypothetical protein